MPPTPLLLPAIVSAALVASAAHALEPPRQSKPAAAAAARIRTPLDGERLREETVESRGLGRTMRYRVLLPAGYEGRLTRYPVLYLLHGLTGDYKDWTTRTNVADHTRDLALIVVMPDGENAWYTNAEGDPAGKFEDYIAADLVADVEAKYRAIRSRYGRAIAGLSMGGYGALKIGMKRPSQFAFAASFSGAFAVARNVEFAERVGGAEGERVMRIYGPAGSQTRRDNDVYAIVDAARTAAMPYLYVDCGTADGLLESNRELVAAIGKKGIAYEYHELPGAHTWDYWDARVKEMLPLLMRKVGRH